MEVENNSVEVHKESKLGTIIVTIILTLFCVGCVIVGIQVGIKWAKEDYENQNKIEEKQTTNEEQKETETKEETKEEKTESEESKELTKADFEKTFFAYLETESKDLYNPENIQEFTLTKVTEIEYEIDSKKNYAYRVSGYFICKDKSESCVYQPVVDEVDNVTGKVKFGSDVYATKEGNKITITGLGTGSTFDPSSTTIELK